MAPRSFKVVLSDKASEELRKVAQELGLSEKEVLIRGLLIMYEYVTKRDLEQKPGDSTESQEFSVLF